MSEEWVQWAPTPAPSQQGRMSTFLGNLSHHIWELAMIVWPLAFLVVRGREEMKQQVTHLLHRPWARGRSNFCSSPGRQTLKLQRKTESLRAEMACSRSHRRIQESWDLNSGRWVHKYSLQDTPAAHCPCCPSLPRSFLCEVAEKCQTKDATEIRAQSLKAAFLSE